ncbi:hypothetical protein HanIR_Chr12g0596841 [Helianthus annuus]|nr:hypothetical protein HanIR_Chr12g0596841 [Helianthus annuus]
MFAVDVEDATRSTSPADRLASLTVPLSLPFIKTLTLIDSGLSNSITVRPANSLITPHLLNHLSQHIQSTISHIHVSH